MNKASYSLRNGILTIRKDTGSEMSRRHESGPLVREADFGGGRKKFLWEATNHKNGKRYKVVFMEPKR